MESFFTVVGVGLCYLLGISALLMLIAFHKPKEFKLEPLTSPNAVAAPNPKPAAPGYVRKWSGGRRAAARRELFLWQENFDMQVAAANAGRRAGGLHGSSTAPPGSDG